MKPFLINVPVRINIWIRPECQKKQFKIIQEARPSILFIQSDGGRNEQEWEAINNNRRLIENGIDWDCTIYRIYENCNNGLYSMGKKVASFIWTKVDRCIFLEDDVLPSVSFFGYCAELLERYKDDQRIEVICGMNHLGKYENVNSDYFFSREGSIWGIATWRRVMAERDRYDFSSDSYVMSLLKHRTRHNRIFQKQLYSYTKKGFYKGHIPGGEFWYIFDIYAQNRLQIVPKLNLVSNIGCTRNSTHSDDISQLPKGLRRIFNMKIYEIEFPLNHPKYVIPDTNYEKKRNRIMGHNYTIIHVTRLIEKLMIKIFTGNTKDIISKVKQNFEKED
jgi:hypothetical protein